MMPGMPNLGPEPGMDPMGDSELAEFLAGMQEGQSGVMEQVEEPAPVPTDPNADTKLKGLKTKEERTAAANEVCDAIEASYKQAGSIDQRWKKVKAQYSLEPVDAEVQLDGEEPRQIPITRVKINSIVASVVDPVTKQDPYFTGKAYGKDAERVEDCQRSVHFFNELGQFDRTMRKATRTSCLAEPAIVKVTMADTREDVTDAEGMPQGGYVGPKDEVIHPQNFAIYPLYSGRIAEAVYVGDRAFMSRQSIEEAVWSGLFYDDVDIDGLGRGNPQDTHDPNNPPHSMTEESSGITDPKDEPVEVWDGIWKKDLDGDGKAERYRVRVARKSRQLLSAERYGVHYDDGTFVAMSRPWYFEWFLQEPEDDEFYRANPVAHNLQGLQSGISGIAHLMIEGGYWNAMPPIFTDSLQLSQQYLKAKPGGLYYTPNVGNIKTVSGAFNPTTLPAMLEKMEQWSDAVSQVSRSASGQASPGVDTATEMRGILAGQAQGENEYRANAMVAACQVCDFKRELVYLHYSTLREVYGDSLPCSSRENLRKPLIWTPNAFSTGDDPQVIIQKIQLLMQMAPAFGWAMAPLGDLLLSALNLPIDVSKLKTQSAPGVGPLNPGGMPAEPGMAVPQGMPPGV